MTPKKSRVAGSFANFVKGPLYRFSNGIDITNKITSNITPRIVLCSVCILLFYAALRYLDGSELSPCTGYVETSLSLIPLGFSFSTTSENQRE